MKVLASPGLVEGERANPFLRAYWSSAAADDVQIVSFSRRGLLARPRPDIVHLHWPETLVRWHSTMPAVLLECLKVLTLLAVAKARGTRLVWTAHNLGPHEMPRPRLFRFYWWFMRQMLDAVFLLNEASRDGVVASNRRLRGVPMRVVPHGHYIGDYPPPPERHDARVALSLPLDSHVVLTVGQLRRYKRIDALATAFSTTGTQDLTLVVAGSVVDDELESDLRSLADGDPRLVLRLGWLDEETVSELHGAADVVVLPYEAPSVLNSGSAILSLSLARPVVVPDTPVMRELRATVGHDWVYLFEGGPVEALALARKAARETRPARPTLDALDWAVVGAKTRAAYRSLRRADRSTMKLLGDA